MKFFLKIFRHYSFINVYCPGLTPCLLNEVFSRKIYNASTRREVVAAFKNLRKHWHTIAPEAVNCLERDMDELLAFF
ncbi:MAG: hypothetical protein AABZ27_04995, partial [Candidatus Omnitrophota bacterium]